MYVLFQEQMHLYPDWHLEIHCQVKIRQKNKQYETDITMFCQFRAFCDIKQAKNEDKVKISIEWNLDRSPPPVIPLISGIELNVIFICLPFQTSYNFQRFRL